MNKALLTITALLLATAYPGYAQNREAAPFYTRDGLHNTRNKLESGTPTRIAYLGGSITKQEGWRVMTQDWLQENYPLAKHVEILAAIGGTNSELGAFRVGTDVLEHDPDLVFVEFAVNDAKTPAKRLRETMEGIVRQIWQNNPQTDICFVYTITEKQLEETANGETFANSASQMEAVADHYGIPSIYMAYNVPILAANGTLLFRTPEPKTDAERHATKEKILFAGDGVHPYIATGHPVYFEQIQSALPALLNSGQAKPHAIPIALEANNFEDAAMIPITQTKLTGNWQKLANQEGRIPSRLKDRMDQIWIGSGEDAKLTLNFEGDYIGIYGARGPDSGAFDFSIDGIASQQQCFDKYCTYHRLSSNTLAANLRPGVHELEITVSDRAIDKAAILRENNKEADLLKNTAKYAGNKLYLAAIMIRGNALEESLQK